MKVLLATAAVFLVSSSLLAQTPSAPVSRYHIVFLDTYFSYAIKLDTYTGKTFEYRRGEQGINAELLAPELEGKYHWTLMKMAKELPKASSEPKIRYWIYYRQGKALFYNVLLVNLETGSTWILSNTSWIPFSDNTQ